MEKIAILILCIVVGFNWRILMDVADRVERIESWEFFYKVSQIKIPKESKNDKRRSG